MSYQAMGAVQLHSQYREDTPDNFAPYKIMLALAWYADSNGRIGQPGDFRKCPGQRAIADRAGVSKTTVNKWLPLIIETGELSIAESGGSGRGSWTVYQIELEMDESDAGTLSETTYQQSREGATDDAGTLLERTYQLMQRTYQLMYQQSQRTYQQNVPNVPSPLEVDVPDPLIHFDPIDPDDPGGTPQPPYPAESTAEDFSAEELAMWQTAVDLTHRWATYRGTYRRLDPGKPTDADDYFRPIAGLVVECGGDGEVAWSLLKQQCEQMLNDGLTVIRAGPVVAQIRSNQQRASLPARPNGNGRSASPAQNALYEYAQLRQELVNHE